MTDRTTCANCNKRIDRAARPASRYCSRRCSDQVKTRRYIGSGMYRLKPGEYPCDDCGEMIGQKPGRGPIIRRCEACKADPPVHGPVACVCFMCGTSMKVRVRDQLYCSNSCRDKQRHLRRYKPVRKFCRDCGVLLPNGKRTRCDDCKILRRARFCRVCGDELPTRHHKYFCSSRCCAKARYRAERGRPIANLVPDGVCHTCSNPLPASSGRGGQRFCSEACYPSSRFARQSPRPKGERFTPTEIFERDSWVCHICGAKTSRDDLTFPHPRYATIDHLIPVSRGGPHTRANVACACWECNRLKGNRVLGHGDQLQLIG